jgi:sirohydrochlorin ferrochelatase
MTKDKTALLLIAHGSRQDEANADLHDIVVEMRGRGEYAVVEGAFLELAKPTIEEASARCVSHGAGRVILLPYFLSAGVHVQQDLTAICRKLADTFPDVDFRLAEPLGPHPLLFEIVAQRARQALADKEQFANPPE